MKRLIYKRRFLFIPLGVAAFLAGISFIVMELWNNLLPALLHVGVITFWQAMGIFVLCKILFGFGHGGKGGAPWMRARMAHNMTPEQREMFRAKMEERWCKSGGWGRGNRHPFEAEWDNNAAEEAAKSAE
jgi:hypothetical protein